VLRLVGVVDPPVEAAPSAAELRGLPSRGEHGAADPRLKDPAALPGAQLVLDGRILGSVASLRPMAWVVLEAVALARPFRTTAS